MADMRWVGSIGEGISRGLLAGRQRQAADERFQMLLDREDEQAKQRRLNELADSAMRLGDTRTDTANAQAFQASEAAKGRTFTGEQNALNRQTTVNEGALNRQATASEAQKNRAFTSSENALNREATRDQNATANKQKALDLLTSTAAKLADAGMDTAEQTRLLNGMQDSLGLTDIPKIQGITPSGDFNVYQHVDGSAYMVNHKTGKYENILKPTDKAGKGGSGSGGGNKVSQLKTYIETKLLPYKIDAPGLEELLAANTPEEKRAAMARMLEGKKNAFQRLDEKIAAGDRAAVEVKAQIEAAYKLLDDEVGLGTAGSDPLGIMPMLQNGTSPNPAQGGPQP